MNRSSFKNSLRIAQSLLVSLKTTLLAKDSQRPGEGLLVLWWSTGYESHTLLEYYEK